jgi:CheY-like chemotaxis protein
MRTKILSIEDATIFRTLIRVVLESKDLEVIEADNGRQGLDIAVQQLPDLILLDLKMPEMNGVEFCKAIKQHHALKNTPIIVLSSSEDANEIEQCMQIGAVEHLMKPFSPMVLLELVKKHIAQAKSAQRI